MSKELIRVDKNGTKYYHCVDKCFKCGGSGYIPQFMQINGGVCFECNGAGWTEWTDKEYTQEYLAKLEAQRAKRAEKKLAEQRTKAVELNKTFFEKNGFNEAGKTYFILGNTYEVKEQLKEQGAKFDSYTRHWRASQKLEGFETLEADVTELYKTNLAGVYNYNLYADNDKLNSLYERVEAAENALNASNSNSNYVGEVNTKVEVKIASFTAVASFSTQFGTQTIYNITDENGNVYVWKTSAYIPEETKSIKGTVKEHTEYKGVKQTVLTRCRCN